MHQPALHGYTSYDSRVVIVGTEVATVFTTVRDDVTHYEQRFADVEALADFGDDVRVVFRRIAADYRAMR